MTSQRHGIEPYSTRLDVLMEFADEKEERTHWERALSAAEDIRRNLPKGSEVFVCPRCGQIVISQTGRRFIVAFPFAAKILRALLGALIRNDELPSSRDEGPVRDWIPRPLIHSCPRCKAILPDKLREMVFIFFFEVFFSVYLLSSDILFLKGIALPGSFPLSLLWTIFEWFVRLVVMAIPAYLFGALAGNAANWALGGIPYNPSASAYLRYNGRTDGRLRGCCHCLLAATVGLFLVLSFAYFVMPSIFDGTFDDTLRNSWIESDQWTDDLMEKLGVPEHPWWYEPPVPADTGKSNGVTNE